MSDLKRFPLHLNKHLYQILAVLKALELHARYKYDGIWAMMAHSCGIPAGLFKYLHPSVPYLLTLQEGDPPEYIERLMRPVWPLFRNGFTKATGLQAISTFLLDWGRHMGFIGEARIIPNAVDIKLFTKPVSEEVHKQMISALGKKDGDVFLVTTSRLVHKNAIDDVIRALPHLSDKVSFLVFGAGPDKSKLETLSKELGVEQRVRFMGYIDHKDLPATFSACDIFIRPSRSEGMGNSFLEAFAAGIPVIATQEGGIKDFLFDQMRNPDAEPTGWAVDANSPEQIAAAVGRILDNPEMRQGTIDRARTLAIEKYDWNIIAANMKVFFEDLCKKA